MKAKAKPMMMKTSKMIWNMKKSRRIPTTRVTATMKIVNWITYLSYYIKIALKVAHGFDMRSKFIQGIHEIVNSLNDPLKLIAISISYVHTLLIMVFSLNSIILVIFPNVCAWTNSTMRWCIMWAFASILSFTYILRALLIRLLQKSLKDEYWTGLFLLFSEHCPNSNNGYQCWTILCGFRCRIYYLIDK